MRRNNNKKSVKMLKIYLLCLEDDMYDEFKETFKKIDNIKVVKDDFCSFMKRNHDVDCIVSPANSYGYMTGGYDAAISDYLGWDFQKNVQKYIRNHFYGEQPIGTSFIIDTNKSRLKLIHTPTMRVPSYIIDDHIIYQCMRTTLMCALKNDVKTIVIPPFGGGCGEVNPKVIAAKMKEAYLQMLLQIQEPMF